MQNQFKKLVNTRTRVLYLALSSILFIFVFQLFWLQIVKHGEYQLRAAASQQKKFTIPAVRGEIYLASKEGPAPLVLNEARHIVWVDPSFISSAESVAEQLAPIIKRSERDLRDQILGDDSQYLEVARDISLEDANKIESLELSGVGFVEYSKRIYPEDSLAAQVVGFVNVDGDGQYGLEQYYNDEIGGVNGQFKAVTDTKGVPLRASDDNVLTDPVDGASINLTIDRSVQSKVENILKAQVDGTKAEKASAVVLNANTGEVVSMANYPTYTPGEYIEVANSGKEQVFVNTATSSPYEPGSIAKIFTFASALEKGVVDPSGNFYDPNVEVINDYRITNTTSFTGSRPTEEIITYSLNTGAVYTLRQLGGGELNGSAKQELYSTFTDKLRLNTLTQIEQANEVNGVIAEPENASDIRYANMSFGQGFTLNLVQAASAYGSIINGGDYYNPYLVDSINYADGSVTENEPSLASSNVVTAATSATIKDLSASVISDSSLNGQIDRSGYLVGGKTGTAQIPSSDGSYIEDLTIGTFMGFVSNELGEQYVIITRIDKPKISGYSGSGAAFPMFADIGNWLIDYYKIPPNKDIK